MNKHTPTPWRATKWGETISIDAIGPHNGIANINPNGDFDKGIPSTQDTANARFIVKAVNCHEELLDACKHAMIILENEGIKRGVYYGKSIDLCEKAIAKAEGQA